MIKIKKTVADYTELVSQWHPTKNGDLKPEDVSYGSKKKVWWKCFDGKYTDGSFADDHEWQAIVCDRTNKHSSCPCCIGYRIVNSNCLMTTHPEISKEWHSDNSITPYEIGFGSGKKVWWQCPVSKDHKYDASPNTRTSMNRNCPFCAGRRVATSNCLMTTHPELSKEWHPKKNGNLTPFDVTAGSIKLVWWKCHKGKWPDGSYAEDHEWQSSPNTRTSRHTSCSCCAGRTVVSSNCLATICPEVVAQWHPNKNGNLTPFNVTKSSSVKVWWMCKKGHETQALISDRSNGHNCSICNESIGENKIRKYLDNNLAENEWKSQFRTKIDRPDFVLIKHKIIIEYNGEQHYRPVAFGSKKPHAAMNNLIANIKRDNLKIERSVKHSITMLIIPFWDIERIEDILDDLFAGRTPTFTEPPEIVKKYALMRQKIRDRLKIIEPEILCGLIKCFDAKCRC